MLSLSPRKGRLRRATNLAPTSEGGLATRPGARQIVAGPVPAAAPWGDRLLLEKQGRIAVWDGAVTDLRAAGASFQAAPYQALTGNAEREDRAYVADGTRPFWFVARRNGAYVVEDVVNSVLDATGVPYALPIPRAVANWSNRLWIGWGTNRVQHCENKNPAYWDPLWTQEMQGKHADQVNALCAHGGQLLVGLNQSVWAISGDSQYNYRPQPLVEGKGTTGAGTLVSDGSRAYFISPFGVSGLAGEPLSEDLDKAFESRPWGGSIVIDGRREWLLCCIGRRLFVMHLGQPGKWGEFVDQGNIAGVFRLNNQIGWYGDTGAWVLVGRDAPDTLLDGTRAPVVSIYETWDEFPNLAGDGRALLERVVLEVAGSSRGSATYTATVDGAAWQGSFTLADNVAATTLGSIEIEEAPLPTARRELVPFKAGARFRHRIEAACHLEVLTFQAKFRGGQ